MTASPLTSKTVRELRELLDRREVSAVELAAVHLDRIEALDKSTVKSLITVTRCCNVAFASVSNVSVRCESLAAVPGESRSRT